MNCHYTRREFLALAAACLGLLAIDSACRWSPELTTPSARGQAVVGLARSADIEKMVRKAIDLAGGLPFLRPNATVLLKPNVNSGDPSPATTNPGVVAAVVKIVREHSPKRVIVADHSNPNTGPTVANMKKVGIYQAAVEAGAEVIGLEDEEWKRVAPQGASHWHGGFSVPKLIIEVDHLITLPVVKAHYMAAYSMALKNTIGLIHPRDRGILHSTVEPSFGSMIAEANLARLADFAVMDATQAMVTGGPYSGRVAQPSLILATSDMIAADVTGLALLKHLGTTSAVRDKVVWEQQQVSRAVELGLGISRADQLILTAEGVPELDSIKGFLTHV